MQAAIHYQRTKAGYPFIFQHGLGSNLNQPQGLLSELTGVELISMDCPGHGNAPLVKDITPSFDYYTDTLVELLDQLKIEKGIFGGISMGSAIAAKVALKHPERVAGLVLVRPAWLDESTPDNLAILIDAAQHIGKAGGQAEFEQIEAFQNIKNGLPKAAQSVLGVFASTQQAEIPLVLEKMVTDYPFSDLSILDKIDVPCLIIGNDEDPLHPFEMAKTLHLKIKGSQLKKVTSRYINNETHKVQVTSIVTNFIKDIIK